MGRLARRAEHPTSADPDECFQDPAWLLLVHRFLPVKHLAVDEAGARDRFRFDLQIKLESPLVCGLAAGAVVGVPACAERAGVPNSIDISCSRLDAPSTSFMFHNT